MGLSVVRSQSQPGNAILHPSPFTSQSSFFLQLKSMKVWLTIEYFPLLRELFAIRVQSQTLSTCKSQPEINGRSERKNWQEQPETKDLSLESRSLFCCRNFNDALILGKHGTLCHQSGELAWDWGPTAWLWHWGQQEFLSSLMTA